MLQSVASKAQDSDMEWTNQVIQTVREEDQRVLSSHQELKENMNSRMKNNV